MRGNKIFYKFFIIFLVYFFIITYPHTHTFVYTFTLNILHASTFFASHAFCYLCFALYSQFSFLRCFSPCYTIKTYICTYLDIYYIIFSYHINITHVIFPFCKRSLLHILTSAFASLCPTLTPLYISDGYLCAVQSPSSALPFPTQRPLTRHQLAASSSSRRHVKQQRQRCRQEQPAATHIHIL